MDSKYGTPWERPEIQTISSIFNGKVINVTQYNIVDTPVYGGTDNGNEV